MIADKMNTSGQRVLAINFVITFLGFLDTHLLIPVLALYAAGINTSIGITGLIIGLYSLTNTPANIIFGRLMDRVGYKIPLTIGLIGDALSMFLYTLCRLPVQLALLRLVHGTSGGLIGPATMLITAQYSDPQQKGRAMGFYGMSIAATTLVGYGLSGLIASRLGYNAIFLFGAGLLTFGAVLSLFLPGSPKRAAPTPKTPLGDGFRLARSLVKRKGLTFAYSSIFAQYFSFGGVVTLLPLYVKSLGMGAFQVGMLLAIFALAFVITQFPGGPLSDRIGRRLPSLSGLGLGIISLVLLPTMTTFPLLAVTMAFYGIAYGILFPPVSALVTDHTVSEERGMATGIFHALLTAGVAIGAPVMGGMGEVVGVKFGLALSSIAMFLALIIGLKTLYR
ncbi:MAG: MFS transporter [Chloroflexota bacterium]